MMWEGLGLSDPTEFCKFSLKHCTHASSGTQLLWNAWPVRGDKITNQHTADSAVFFLPL
jgi:hypothetical protein